MYRKQACKYHILNLIGKDNNIMTCRECNNDMYLDDVDYNFKGNKDNYWCCEKCQTSCIEKIRYGKSFKEIWYTENGDIVKDETISVQTEKANGQKALTI